MVVPNVLKTYSAGEKNAFELGNGKFGETLRTTKNEFELFEKWMSVESLVEKNWVYRINKQGAKGIIIDSYPNPMMVDALGKSDYGNSSIDLFRAQFAAVLPKYIDRPKADVKIEKSIFSGHNFTRFAVEFAIQ